MFILSQIKQLHFVPNVPRSDQQFLGNFMNLDMLRHFARKQREPGYELSLKAHVEIHRDRSKNEYPTLRGEDGFYSTKIE